LAAKVISTQKFEIVTLVSRSVGKGNSYFDEVDLMDKSLKNHIKKIHNLRHKLLFIVVNSIDQPNDFFGQLEAERIPVINLNLLLADQLRKISPNERPFEVKNILHTYLEQTKAEIACLHHFEYLFDPELKQDPIRLFESLSGNRILIVLWPGEVEKGILRYASPEHQEFYQNAEYAHAIYPLEN
jgi:hypothetical protein